MGFGSLEIYVSQSMLIREFCKSVDKLHELKDMNDILIQPK